MGKRFIFLQSLFIILFGFSAIGFAASSAATSDATNNSDQASWYQIEIIIFENVNSKETSSEVWPNNPGLPNFGDVVELTAPQSDLPENNGTADTGALATPDAVVPAEPADSVATPATTELATDTGPTQPQPYQLLPSDEFSLTRQEIKLTSSEQYYPLLHVAWRQPVLSEDNAKSVHIYSNMEQPQADDIQSSLDDLAKPPQDEFFSYQEPSNNEAPMNVIDGTIKISLGKYLHLDADILYRTQAEAKNEFSIFGFKQEDESANVFRMQESRRMRSGELNYFDHPLFGMLVLITPYRLPGETGDTIEAVPTNESAPSGEPVPPDEQDQDNNDELPPD